MSNEDSNADQKLFVSIISRYYSDADFKAKLDADPAGVLRTEGVDIPADSNVKLLFNTDKRVHIVLPYIEGDE